VQEGGLEELQLAPATAFVRALVLDFEARAAVVGLADGLSGRRTR